MRPDPGPDGVIYTGEDGIYAINPDLARCWRSTGGHHRLPWCWLTARSSPVSDDVVGLCRWHKRWTSARAGDVESAPAVARRHDRTSGPTTGRSTPSRATARCAGRFDGRRSRLRGRGNGNDYVGLFDAQLYAVRLDGTLAWTFRGDRIISSALVDAKGAILFGSRTPPLLSRARRPSALVGGGRRRRRQPPTLAAMAPSSWDRTITTARCARRRAGHIPQIPQIKKRNLHWHSITFQRRRPPAVGLLTRRLTGRIRFTRGLRLVVPDDKSEDVRPGGNRGTVTDADTSIEAPARRARIEGRVLRVVSRGRAKITGQLCAPANLHPMTRASRGP
jgi:hypothetical protein